VLLLFFVVIPIVAKAVLDQSTWPAANAGGIFRFIGLRAGGLPAANNGHRHRKAVAKPITRTVVATVRTTISAAASATSVTATPAVATMAAATCTTPTSVAAAVGSESVTRHDSAAQH
jgi:hypothetical protein